MHAAEGILTSRGGMTSHAAVVARGWGKPCVCGCEALQIDEKRGVMTVLSTREEVRAPRVGTARAWEGGGFRDASGCTGAAAVL